MAWLDNIEAPLQIKTGDGKTFEPNNVFASKERAYNIAQFDFPNVKGSLVHRGQPKGNKYTLEIYFQGEDHIEESTAFLTSADDPRKWTITHPYYGAIDVQPIKLTIDNSQFNITKITGTVIETIADIFPAATVVPEDKINSDKEVNDEVVADSYAEDVPAPDNTDKALMNTTVDDLEASTGPTITDDIEASKFKNAVQSARAAISTATNAPLAAMRKIQAVINAPLLLKQTVEQRLNLITEQLNRLIQNFTGDPETIGPDEKVYVEATLAVLMTLQLAVGGQSGGGGGGSTSRSSVENTIDVILGNYDLIIQTLDALQTPTGGDPDSYVPDPDIQLGLNNLVTFTVSNLFDIALDARQEREIFLEEESDVINLAHRFYGSKPDDSEIDEFIATNNIGLSEILSIRKGRKILYYV